MIYIIVLIVLAVGLYIFYRYKKQESVQESVQEEEQPEIIGPEIMGLRIGSSFDIDPLMLKMENDNLVTSDISPSQIIQGAGVVDLGDGTKAYRFYTDDDAWLQVIAEGGTTEDHVVDVKLFHYFDTTDYSSQENWDDLLFRKIGAKTWELEENTYERVWKSDTDYHQPVHMREYTTIDTGDITETDQFVMLFERDAESTVESLFVSGEEKVVSGQVERCLVISTGITLSPAEITING